MNWREYILQLKTAAPSTNYGFNLFAENLQLKALKIAFNLSEIPLELEELYKQTNGVSEKLNNETICELIWPVERVIETNKEYRNYEDFKDLYMSFEQLLFFSDAGNGDCFGFVTLNGRFNRNDVFVWNHEDDSRTWVAPDLKIFIKWRLNGTIKV